MRLTRRVTPSSKASSSAQTLNPLLTGGGDPKKSGDARLWDALSGCLLGIPLTHTDLVARAAFSPDGQTIATAGFDGTARLADIATGRAGPVLQQHTKPVYVVAFHAEGTRVLTASEDGVAQLWDVKTGNAVGKALKA